MVTKTQDGLVLPFLVGEWMEVMLPPGRGVTTTRAGVLVTSGRPESIPTLLQHPPTVLQHPPTVQREEKRA
jgi:hypothetical protein